MFTLVGHGICIDVFRTGGVSDNLLTPSQEIHGYPGYPPLASITPRSSATF